MVCWHLAAQGSNTQSKELLAGSPGSLTPISALKFTTFTLHANLLVTSGNYLHLSECSLGCGVGTSTWVQVTIVVTCELHGSGTDGKKCSISWERSSQVGLWLDGAAAGKAGRDGAACALVLQPKWDLGLQGLVLEAPLPVWGSLRLGLPCRLSLLAAAWHLPLFFLQRGAFGAWANSALLSQPYFPRPALRMQTPRHQPPVKGQHLRKHHPRVVPELCRDINRGAALGV